MGIEDRGRKRATRHLPPQRGLVPAIHVVQPHCGLHCRYCRRPVGQAFGLRQAEPRGWPGQARPRRKMIWKSATSRLYAIAHEASLPIRRLMSSCSSFPTIDRHSAKSDRQRIAQARLFDLSSGRALDRSQELATIRVFASQRCAICGPMRSVGSDQNV
jgi:hypothetical protein